MKSSIINIPVGLVKQAARHKDAKDLLAFAVCIKGLFVSSNLTHCTVRKVASLLHVNNNRAQRLLYLVGISDLFKFDYDTKTLHAVSFHSPITKMSRSGLMYRSDFCFKLKREDLFEEVDVTRGGVKTKEKAITMRKAARVIEHIAFLNEIQARFRDNRLIIPNSNCRDVYLLTASMNELGHTMGFSRTTARRRMDEYVSEGYIKTFKPRNIMEAPVASDDCLEYNAEYLEGYYHFKCPYNNMVYICVPTCIVLGSIDRLLSYFVHVIWNHQSRVGQRKRKYYSERTHGHRNKYRKAGATAPARPRHTIELQILPLCV